MKHHLSIDLETYSSVPIAKSGAYKYIQSPDFEILLFAYSLDNAPVEIVDLAQGELLPDWLYDAISNPEYIKHAYNAAFEWYCLSKFCGHILPVDQWRDTMLHGLYCGFTAGLDATGKALGLPEEKQKLATGKALIRYFCVPCTPTQSNGGRRRNYPRHDMAKWELFKTYCKGDVVTEMEIENRLSAFPVPDDVEKQWQTDLTINARGVAVDMDMVQGAIEIGDSTRDSLMAEATSISGLDNPNSIAQLSTWLEKQTDVSVADLRKDTVSAMLESGAVEGSAKRMLEIRQELGKTSTKKYDAIEAAVGADGRVRGLLQFYGANRTGRWAGRLVQVQNLPRTYIGQLPLAREAVKQKEAEKLGLLYGSVPDTLSQLIRTSFIASKGNKLVDADFSAIEARVISWLAGEQWRLEVFRTHGKIYEASASQMFGVPIEKIAKGNPEYALRQKGKVAELALGYQGGSPALIAMGALRMGIPEDDLPDIVSRWRQTNKRIVDLWYSVESAAVSVIQTGASAGVRGLIFAREMDLRTGMDFLTITLPSSRKLFYSERIRVAQTRADELEKLLCRIYEDHILKKIPNERYQALDSQYSQELKRMKEEIASCEAALSERTQRRGSASKFAALFDNYQTFDHLTPAILHQFVDHIVIHERAIKGSHTSPQQIDIYFNFIGNFIPPNFGGESPTAEQQEEMRQQEERRKKFRQAYQRRKADGSQKRYEERTKEQKRARREADKAACRSEDIANGIYTPVQPILQPQCGVINT